MKLQIDTELARVVPCIINGKRAYRIWQNGEILGVYELELIAFETAFQINHTQQYPPHSEYNFTVKDAARLSIKGY